MLRDDLLDGSVGTFIEHKEEPDGGNESLENPDQPLVSGKVAERLVKVDVLVGDASIIASRTEVLEPLLALLEGIERRLRVTEAEQMDGTGFDCFAESVDVAGPAFRDTGDDDSAIGPLREQAFSEEKSYALSNGASAYSEHVREVDFDQPLTWSQ
jgi:hypothetical protein